MSERGFSLVELAVVVVCIGILSGILLDRALPLIGLAERTAFEQVRGQLSSALLLEAAERIARGESATLAAYEGANPMELLLKPPSNYLGTVADPAHQTMPRRSWYFDPSTGALFYRAGRGARIAIADRPAELLALRTRFAFRDRDGDRRFDPSRDAFDGLALEPVESYVWATD